jgi:hypothetical protein
VTVLGYPGQLVEIEAVTVRRADGARRTGRAFPG